MATFKTSFKIEIKIVNDYLVARQYIMIEFVGVAIIFCGSVCKCINDIFNFLSQCNAISFIFISIDLF